MHKTRIEQLVDQGKNLNEINETLKSQNSLGFAVRKKIKKEYPLLEVELPLTIEPTGENRKVVTTSSDAHITVRANERGALHLFINARYWVSTDEGRTWIAMSD